MLPQNRLTSTIADAALPRDKPHRLFDGAGLYLEVMPNGSKYWRLKYRYGGKEKRLALGAYPSVSIDSARELRDVAKADLAAKIDPAEGRRARAAANRPDSAVSFLLSQHDDGALTIEANGVALMISCDQVAALRAFLTVGGGRAN